MPHQETFHDRKVNIIVAVAIPFAGKLVNTFHADEFDWFTVFIAPCHFLGASGEFPLVRFA
jgi:hypothetical protein